MFEVRFAHSFTCPVTSDSIPRRTRLDLTNDCVLRLDTARVVTDPSYFNSFRPQPLKRRDSLLVEHSQLEAQHVTLQTERRTPFQKSLDRTASILFSSHSFDIGNKKHSNFRIPPLLSLSMLSYSGTRGLAVKTRLLWRHFTSSSSPLPLVTFDPYVGYSFKEKLVYYELPLSFNILPRQNGLLTFSGGGGNRAYSNRQAEAVKERLKGIERYDSLAAVLDSYEFTYYRDNFFKSDFSISPFPGLSVALGLRYHRRTMIDWNKVAAENGILRTLSNIGPRLQLTWTPMEYYYRHGLRRMPLYSCFPTFNLIYEHGYAIGRGESSFERYETDVHYRLHLYAMRSLYFRAGGGFFTRRRLDCFLSYDYFNFNNMPGNWSDELCGEFQLLSSRWFNESSYYARFHGSYESPMLVFSRIPGLSRLVYKERIYLNLLSVRSLPIYAETGYGVSTLFCDTGLFLGIAHDRSLTFGARIVFKLFEE